jgi:hypothetical protein
VIEKKSGCASGISAFLAEHGKRRACGLKEVPPVFFVSVAFKGFRISVNPLEATLTGILVRATTY